MCPLTLNKNKKQQTMCYDDAHLSFAETGGARISFTANRNCMAQTSRQHKFNDNDKAHRAKVTS